MKKEAISNWVSYFIAAVWIINGFFCKLLTLVPRHQQIFERILAYNHGRSVTVFIGLAEVGMAAWILSGINTRLNAIAQIVIIAIMNVLEFFLAPDLLLWGKANAIFAFMFIALIYYNEFSLNKKVIRHTACFP